MGKYHRGNKQIQSLVDILKKSEGEEESMRMKPDGNEDPKDCSPEVHKEVGKMTLRQWTKLDGEGLCQQLMSHVEENRIHP